MYLEIGHRGASAYEPENTLRSFHRAFELSADMVELDIHLSKDGRAVVIHSEDLHHTTDGHGCVQDKTLAELKLLDAGRGERIPTLREAIGVARGQGGSYIELKGEGTPQVVAKIVRAEDFVAHVIVGSFKPWLVRDFKALAPEMRTSILVGQTDVDHIALARAVGADYVHLCWENRSPAPHELLTPELLAAIHAAGLGIILWHEERESELAALTKIDVDGICSNKPDLL